MSKPTLQWACPALALLFALVPLVTPLAHAAGDVQAGRAAFQSKCASCHKVGPAARANFGPHLNGLFGRKAGGTGDYAYSAAMKASGIVWSAETLRAFLHSPGKVVPDNKMRFWGLRSDREIDDLLAYLRTFQAVAPTAAP